MIHTLLTYRRNLIFVCYLYGSHTMLRHSKYRLSGREGSDVCQVAIFGEVRASGYVKGYLHKACSSPLFGVRRVRRPVSRTSIRSMGRPRVSFAEPADRPLRRWQDLEQRLALHLEHLFIPGLGDAFINGHLADQRLAIWQMHRPWAPHTVARGRGQIPFPLVSHPAYLITGRAVSIASGAAFPLCPGPMPQAPAKHSLWVKTKLER